MSMSRYIFRITFLKYGKRIEFQCVDLSDPKCSRNFRFPRRLAEMGRRRELQQKLLHRFRSRRRVRPQNSDSLLLPKGRLSPQRGHATDAGAVLSAASGNRVPARSLHQRQHGVDRMGTRYRLFSHVRRRNGRQARNHAQLSAER